MTAVLVRLVVRRMATAPARTLLLVMLFSVTAAVLTVAVALVGTTSNAWERAHRATRGGDVQIASFDPFDRAAVMGPGVRAASGPYVGYVVPAHLDLRPIEVMVWSVPALADIEVDRPVVAAGRWPQRAGEVALEQTFAAAVGAGVGSELDVPFEGRKLHLRVSGVVTTTRTPPYPVTAPGSAFLGGGGSGPPLSDRRLYQASVRLDPGASESTVRSLLGRVGSPHAIATTAASIRRDTLAEIRPVQVVLLSFGVLLGTAVIALLALQMSARLLDVAGRVGQLRVAGVAPSALVATLAAENIITAVVGAVAGVGLGMSVTPYVAARVAQSLGAVNATYQPGPLVAVVGSIVAVAAMTATAAAWRWTRAPIAPATRGAGLGGARPSRLASRALHSTSAVGAIATKEATSHRGRAAVVCLSVALAVMAGVAALAMEASFEAAGEAAASAARLRTVVYSLEAALVAVALATVGVGVATAVRERVREHAMLRAIGVSTAQLAAAIAAAQGIVGAVGAVVGVPLGLGLFRVTYGLAGGAADEIGWPSPVACLTAPAVAVAVVVTVAAASAYRRTSVTTALIRPA